MNPTLALTELSHHPDTTGSVVLDRNLAALRRANPSGHAASIVQSAFPRADIEWLPTQTPGPDGTPLLTASVTEWTLTGAVPRSLASRRDPVMEAGRLAAQLNTAEAAAIVVLGFGLGYHVAEIARRVKNNAVIILFEPDAGLMRAALERIDLSEALGGCVLHLLTDADDEAAMSGITRGLEGFMALGTTVIEHPASQPRLGSAGKRFMERFTRVMMAVRTSVVTTMVQTETTLRNLTQNIDHYSGGGGVADLAGVLAGRPGIVVSAGPSLARNVELLGRAGVRDRFAIIATQTVLKPLLARGIRPHFVVALDHHEISLRFYEGLTAKDVEGITLVVEPKVNPAVTSAFPGAIRCVGDDFLDLVLGSALSRPMGKLPAGATVAHLAYSLARHMGCDPVVLVGQDLGFTDGQYYAAGAAIHNVWAGELNEFNTLEMLEWQRIVRMRQHLHLEQDVLGRPIYTDEQMATYLVQFQALFKADSDRGLLTIDSTEGGVAKAFTMARPLEESITLLGTADGPTTDALLPRVGVAGTSEGSGVASGTRARTRALIERLRDVRRGVWQVGALSRDARVVLSHMLEHHADQQRVNTLIASVQAIRDRVSAIQPAFHLVELLNQTGVFNRYKADRRINLADDLDPLARQRAQIERDITNVSWLADAADALGTMLDASVTACSGGPKRTSDLSPGSGRERTPAVVARASARLPAIVGVDADTNGLGIARDLAAPVFDGRNALQLTVARLARCERVDMIVLLSTDVPRTRAMLGTPPPGARVVFREERSDGPIGSHAARRAARLPAAHCWRGGLGNLSIYDEAIWPAATARALADLPPHAPAALVVGADWSLVDPALCDRVIERYHEAPDAHRLVFSQAAPGLAGCVVDRTMLEQFAGKRAEAGAFVSLGGVLGYVPTAPMPDLLAKPMCVHVEPVVRDGLVRCTVDAPGHSEVVLDALRRANCSPLTAGAAEVARALAALGESTPGLIGRTLELRLTNARGTLLSVQAAAGLIGALGAAAHSAVLTIAADDHADPLDHSGLAEIVGLALAADVGCIHIRTPLTADAARVEEFLAGPRAHVVSVDLVADDAPTYAAITGRDDFERVRANCARLFAWRADLGAASADGRGIPTPWIVPRIARCDAVYTQIENWYDHWLLTAGWAVIDPPAAATVRAGERITPLPLPALAARRQSLLCTVIGPDGRRRA